MGDKEGASPRRAPSWAPVGLDSLVAAQPAGAANPAQGAKALDAAPASATVEVPDEHDPWIGRVIGGKYRLARRLGRGGMAFVYEAEVLGRIKREVAVKVLTPESAISQSTIARFLKEADAIAQIQHPHVVQLIELVETPEGVLVLVMERLRGKSLQELLQEMHARGENFRWERLAPRMLEVCSALQAAHELGIVHRDIKPSNLFVCNVDGKTPYLKILDFGIAKAQARRTADDSIETPLTQEGMFLGTPHFAAPEAIRQQSDDGIDGRADIFALGVVMYQCLTGSLPFQHIHHDKLAVLYHTAYEKPTPLRERAPEQAIPREVESLVLRAMERDPNKRFATADDLAEAIRQTLHVSSPPAKAPAEVKTGSILDLSPPPPPTRAPKQPGNKVIIGKSPREQNSSPPENPPTPIHGQSRPSTSSQSPTVPQDTNSHTPVGAIIVLVVMLLGLLALLVFLVREFVKPTTAAQPVSDSSKSGAPEAPTSVREVSPVAGAAEPPRGSEKTGVADAPPIEEQKTETIEGERETTETLTPKPPESPVVAKPKFDEAASEAQAVRRGEIRARLDQLANSKELTECLPLSTMFADGKFEQLAVKVRVDARGTVSASAGKTHEERPVASESVPCILSALNRSSFPAGDGLIIVSHVLKFD